jgi:hypothetical protein
MKLVKADNAPGFSRDPTNQAVLSTDISALQAYKAKKRRERQVDDALHDINTLKQEMSEIKGLILQLLEKKNG